MKARETRSPPGGGIRASRRAAVTGDPFGAAPDSKRPA